MSARKRKPRKRVYKAFEPVAEPGDRRPKARHQRKGAEERDERAEISAIERILSDRAGYLDWLDENAGGVQMLADATARLRRSPDPRVRAKAVQLEMSARGLLGSEDREVRVPPNITFVVNVPKLRELPKPSAPALPEPKP